MLTNFRAERKKLVFVQNGRGDMPIGQLIDLIIDPDNGHCDGLWIESIEGVKVLEIANILAWESEKILIESLDDLIDPAKISAEMKDALNREVRIIDAPVWHKRKKIGSVQNFEFDTIQPKLLNIATRSGWLFWQKDQKFPRKNVQKINRKGVYLKADSLSGESVKKTKKSAENTRAIPEVETKGVEKDLDSTS